MASSFYYVAVKGALASSDCDAFGLDPEEILALTKRFPNSKAVVTNGVSIKGIGIKLYQKIKLCFIFPPLIFCFVLFCRATFDSDKYPLSAGL